MRQPVRPFLASIQSGRKRLPDDPRLRFLGIPDLAGLVDDFGRQASIAERASFRLRNLIPAMTLDFPSRLRRVIFVGQSALRHCLDLQRGLTKVAKPTYCFARSVEQEAQLPCPECNENRQRAERAEDLERLLLLFTDTVSNLARQLAQLEAEMDRKRREKHPPPAGAAPVKRRRYLLVPFEEEAQASPCNDVPEQAQRAEQLESVEGRAPRSRAQK